MYFRCFLCDLWVCGGLVFSLCFKFPPSQKVGYSWWVPMSLLMVLFWLIPAECACEFIVKLCGYRCTRRLDSDDGSKKLNKHLFRVLYLLVRGFDRRLFVPCHVATATLVLQVLNRAAVSEQGGPHAVRALVWCFLGLIAYGCTPLLAALKLEGGKVFCCPFCPSDSSHFKLPTLSMPCNLPRLCSPQVLLI